MIKRIKRKKRKMMQDTTDILIANSQDMIWMIQSEWMRLCSTITIKEVARAVNQCRTRDLVRVNNSVDRFFDIATCIHRRGCYETFNNRLAEYEVSSTISCSYLRRWYENSWTIKMKCRYVVSQRVTVEVLRDVANKYIYDQCPAVAAIGPVENLPDYNCIRSYMYQIRH